MPDLPHHENQVAALAALANGVIPSDEIDAGASAVNAGERLSEKILSGVQSATYLNGLRVAERISKERFRRATEELDPAEIHELLNALREEAPGFFKQLRMDVAAMYLSDPGVWKRIGFPGPSFESGGYPDFNQPQ